MNEIKLTYQAGKGFKKMIGWTVGDDGQKRPKIWWLGRDEIKAVELVKLIQFALDQFRAEGMGECWTPDHISRIRAAIERRHKLWDDMVRGAQYTLSRFGPDAETRPAAQTFAPALTASPTGPGMTMKTAIADYTALLRLKVPHQLSQGNYNRQAASLKCVHEVIPAGTLISAVGKRELEQLVAHFTSRPVRKKTGRRMAPDMVITTVKQIAQFFDWLDGDAWAAPPGPSHLG